MDPDNVPGYDHFSCSYQHALTLTGVISGGAQIKNILALGSILFVIVNLQNLGFRKGIGCDCGVSP